MLYYAVAASHVQIKSLLSMRQRFYSFILLITVLMASSMLTPEEKLREPLLEKNYDDTIYTIPDPLLLQIWYNSACNVGLLDDTPDVECRGLSNVSEEPLNRKRTLPSSLL